MSATQQLTPHSSQPLKLPNLHTRVRCFAFCLCTYVRSIIWYVALDPLKWILMYILNEDGVRDREGWKRLVHARPKAKQGE